MFDTAVARLATIGCVHRHLYGRLDEPGVDLQLFLEELCADVASGTCLKLDVKVEPILVSSQMARDLAVVLHELAMNAAKYAYGEQAGGTLTIHCARDGEDLRLVVTDGGKGLKDGFDPDGAEGLGMRIVNSIVTQLGGSFRAQNCAGARFTLTAPVR